MNDYSDNIETKPKGNTGLVLGILGLFFFHLIFGILALVFAKKDKSEGACIALGVIDLVIWGFSSLWFFIVGLPILLTYIATLGFVIH